jgi:mRNA-degrading endonuclease RelE of RelBE toxin-antitoxin system
MKFKVCFSEPFKRSLRRLIRKYRTLRHDLEIAIELLLLYPDIGRVIPGTHNVRKLRVRSSDISKGKHGGFRLLYLVDREGDCIILLFMYAKPEKENISSKEIEQILKEALGKQ